MRKIIIGSLLVIGLAAGISYAHGNGWGGHMMGQGFGGHMMGPGHGRGHMMGYDGDYNDCPGAAYFGETGWNSKAHQKFLEDTVGVRKELNDKRFEYSENRRNPEANQDRLSSLENEIIGLEKQLRDKARLY